MSLRGASKEKPGATKQSYYMRHNKQIEGIASRLNPLTGLLAMTIVICLLALSSCGVNPNMQGKGEAYLQGEWQQDSVAGQSALLSYTSYHLKFDCDSFYFSINNYSKVNTGADSCTAHGHWTEYVKGTYRQRNDTLFVKGFYANANFGYKETGCFHIGPYQQIFKINSKNASALQLSDIGSVMPINLHNTKHTTCKPKAL